MGEHISAHNSWPLRESNNSSSLSCWPPPRIDSEDSGDRKRGTIPTRSPTGAGAGGTGLSCLYGEGTHQPPRGAHRQEWRGPPNPKRPGGTPPPHGSPPLLPLPSGISFFPYRPLRLLEM